MLLRQLDFEFVEPIGAAGARMAGPRIEVAPLSPVAIASLKSGDGLVTVRGKVVGRITAQIDHAYLERYQDSTGHFGCLVAEDDPAIFAALFKAAEDWARTKGMKRITGP